MLKQENKVEITNKNSDNNHNPLNEHDYCSPNKNRTTTRPEQPSQSTNLLESTKLHPSQMPASDSLEPVSSLLSDTKTNDNDNDVAEPSMPNNFSNDNLSDLSSSSSSLSSSFESSKELVIAQDSNKAIVKPLKSKNPLSISSRKHKHAAGGAMERALIDQETSRVRAKRARQSTSVTDKSEWIMGDDQIDSVLSEHLDEGRREKRQKSHKELDDEFTQLSSSDYSESEPESDQDSEYNSEDDPDKLWCVCRKPHGGKFMISCDVCKDWFHGHCVNVTKLMGDRFEKQGKEWFCNDCQDKLKSGIPRSAIPIKRVEKESKKKKPVVPGKRGRGRPRKSESMVREGAIRVSQRNLRKSSSSLDPKVGVDNTRLRKNLARSEARSESFDEFENSQKLKELIKERKKEFFYKRHLAEQQRASKRSELGLGRQSLTANLSHGLDSLATSTSTPNMNNLPINIKSEHKERSKPNIVLQINTKKDSGATQSNPGSRIVTTIVRSSKKSKHMDSSDPVVNDLFTAEPIQINKKVKVQDTSASTNQTSGDTIASNGDSGTRKRSNSSSLNPKNEKSTTEHEPTTPKKKRKDSESSTPNGSSTTGGSKYIAQKIKDSLETRSKQIKDLEVSPVEIERLATEIEGQLNECFKEGTQKYLNKFRSLIFNLRDPKNQGLVKNVLTGEILPSRLVRMSPDEMASHELAKWRERENKHSIELIKRDAQLAAQQVIVKKTHKGEEVISAPSLKDSEDPTGEVDNNEPPTTPTKPSPKESRNDGTKITVTPPATLGVSKSSVPLKMKITGITSDSSALKAATQEPANSYTPVEDSIPFLETTKDHKNHIFDINCKICTKQVDETSVVDTSSKQEVSKSDQTTPESKKQQSDQPKRFRVSIDTKLDPANISRLKEPLIKPSQQSSLDLDEEPAKTPPFHQTKSNDEDEDGEESNSDFGPVFNETSAEPPMASNEPCWTGSITMPDIAKFSASAKPVSGTVDFLTQEINQNLMVCGRIAPDQVQGYIKKLKSTTKNQILIIQLFPLTEDDRSNFDTFFDYLYKRNRYGVIQTSPQILKDFYVLPIHEKSSLPDILKPIRGPGIDRKEPNCLVGLLVRSKRSPSNSSSYTPTPIK